MHLEAIDNDRGIPCVRNFGLPQRCQYRLTDLPKFLLFNDDAKWLISHLLERRLAQRLYPDSRSGVCFQRNSVVNLAAHLGQRLTHSTPYFHLAALLGTWDVLPACLVVLTEDVAAIPVEAQALLFSGRFDAAHTYIRSTASATALPPPRQSAAMPRFRLRRCNS